MTVEASVYTSRDLGPAPEQEVVRDLTRKGVYVLPLVVAFGAIGWGTNGAVSAFIGLATVLANFNLAAALQAWAAKISFGLVAGVALFGFLIRLAIISGFIWLVKGMAWFEPMPLLLTLAIGHVALLFWESRFVSASLAFPGLKPDSIKEYPRCSPWSSHL